MSESHQEISTRLGSGFAALVMNFLPACLEGLDRIGEGGSKDISFGATVKMRLKDGVVVGKLIPHEPKIPTEPMEESHFVLKREMSGQLSFLFAGTLDELKAEVNKQAAGPQQPGDGYEPSHNPTSG